MECPQSFTTFPLQSSIFQDDVPEFAFSVEEMVNGQVFSPSDPLTDQQADASPDREYWAAARAEELSAHMLNNTYSELLELPRGQTFTNTGFIYKTKLNSNGEVERFKARLVFKNHRFSTPTKAWDEVFSPVVDKSTLRIFLSYAAQCKYFIRQIDIVTAFLNAPMTDTCYIKLPRVCGDPPDLVRKLFKALYGHVEAPKLWNMEWSTVMQDLGFVQSKRDPCLWMHGGKNIILVLYVDDSLICAKTKRAIDKLIAALKLKFRLRELGQPTQFLGMTVSYYQDHGVLALSQKAYIHKLSSTYPASAAVKYPTTPVVADFYKQLPTASPVLDSNYRSLVGGLIFVAVSTRPDISFAVSLLTQAFSAPTDLHISTAYRCLAYLVGTSEYGLTLGGPVSNDILAFSDSDWANCPSTRKSMGGFIVFFGISPVSWSSKRHIAMVS